MSLFGSAQSVVRQLSLKVRKALKALVAGCKSIPEIVHTSACAGLPRRVCVGITITIWTALILYLDFALWLRDQPLVVAACVTFLLAFTVFRYVARWTFDATVAWRAVDYLWVGAAVGTIVITTANLQLAAQRSEISALRSDIQISGGALVRSIDQLHSFCNKIEAVTQGKPTETASSDTTVLFERRKHYGSAFGCQEIPRLSNEVKDQIALPNWPMGRPWIHSYLDLICDGTLRIQGAPKIDYDRTLVSQMQDLVARSRDEICTSAYSLDHVGRQFLDSDKRLASLTGSPLVGRIVSSHGLFWWYMALAYAAGLRLGKVHAEILQVQRRPKPTAS